MKLRTDKLFLNDNLVLLNNQVEVDVLGASERSIIFKLNSSFEQALNPGENQGINSNTLKKSISIYALLISKIDTFAFFMTNIRLVRIVENIFIYMADISNYSNDTHQFLLGLKL